MIKGFVEGVYDRVDEESVKRDSEENSKRANNDDNSVSQEQTNHKKENPIEKQFEEAVQEYMKTQRLEYPNLESDPRFDQIKKEKMDQWLKNNPEPHKGKQKLTDKERTEWFD